MTNIAPPNQAKRFCASTCPICRERALESYVGVHIVQFECGRCGGYAITASARSMISKRSYALRREWLEHARQAIAAKGEVALVDSANQPLPGAGVMDAGATLDSTQAGVLNAELLVPGWRRN